MRRCSAWHILYVPIPNSQFHHVIPWSNNQYKPLPLITSRVAQEHKLFATLVASTQPIGLENLATETGLESRVLESILDYLGTQGMVLETEPGHFTSTKITHLLTVPLFQDAITHL